MRSKGGGMNVPNDNPRVIDLMAALEASLAEAKKAQDERKRAAAPPSGGPSDTPREDA